MNNAAHQEFAQLTTDERDEYRGLMDCFEGYPADPNGSPTYQHAYGAQYAREQEKDHEF